MTQSAELPWQEDWSTQAGDCVGVKQVAGIGCKLYSNGSEGFKMLVHIDDKIATKYSGSDVFFDTGRRLCAALGAPVTVRVFLNSSSREMRTVVLPPNCAATTTVVAAAKKPRD